MASTHLAGATSRDDGLLPRHVGVGAQAGRRDRGEVMPALIEGDYTAKPRRLLHGDVAGGDSAPGRARGGQPLGAKGTAG